MADPQWRDKHGDIWTAGSDGLLHTPETAPFSREHVEKKWGPLIPIPQGPDVSALEPLRFREFAEAYERLGLVSTYAIDPVDGEKIVALDWHDVSKLMQHYEGEIQKLKDLIAHNHQAYLSVQGISDEPGERLRGGIHE